MGTYCILWTLHYHRNTVAWDREHKAKIEKGRSERSSTDERVREAGMRSRSYRDEMT